MYITSVWHNVLVARCHGHDLYRFYEPHSTSSLICTLQFRLHTLAANRHTHLLASINVIQQCIAG